MGVSLSQPPPRVPLAEFILLSGWTGGQWQDELTVAENLFHRLAMPFRFHWPAVGFPVVLGEIFECHRVEAAHDQPVPCP